MSNTAAATIHDKAKEQVNGLLQLLATAPDEAVMARAAFRDFAQTVVSPLDDEMNEKGAFAHALWKQMGDQGLLGLTVPETYGGAGLGYLYHVMATEEISAASGSAGLSYLAFSNLCVNQIVLNGSDAQKQQYLPALVSGDIVGALAMSEADAGSDVMSMKTTAEKVEGGWKINGSKLWITNGGRYLEDGTPVTADVLVLYARTGDKKTAFIVDGNTPGFKTGYKIKKETLAGSETWELQFENCVVPDSAVLGTVNKGQNVLMRGLNYERLILAAGALGLAQAAVNLTQAALTDRKQFGQPIGFNSVKAHQYADCLSKIKAVRAQVYMYAAQADRGIALSNSDCASAFLNASVMAKDVARMCQEMWGGMGLTQDVRLARIVRDAQLYATGGGSEDIRRHVIACEEIPGYAEAFKTKGQLLEAFNGMSPVEIKAVIAAGKSALKSGGAKNTL